MTKWTRNAVVSALILTLAGAVLVPEPVVAADQVRVAVIQVEKDGKIEYRVRPATVLLNPGDDLLITNYTDLPKMAVTILGGVEGTVVDKKDPENVPAASHGKKASSRIRIKFKKNSSGGTPDNQPGDYTYQVQLSRDDGTGVQIADGESAPHVIIDP